MRLARISDRVDWVSVEARLDGYLRAATSRQYREGLRWYPTAHHIAGTLTAFTELERKHAAGIIAALSPQSSWATNLRQAEELISTGYCSNTAQRLDKAVRIRDGETPVNVLHGPKELAFYFSIINPIHARTACIDRHMFRAAMGLDDLHELRLWTQRRGTAEKIGLCVTRLADKYAIPVPAAQAVIWTVIRDSRRGLR